MLLNEIIDKEKRQEKIKELIILFEDSKNNNIESSIYYNKENIKIIELFLEKESIISFYKKLKKEENNNIKKIIQKEMNEHPIVLKKIVKKFKLSILSDNDIIKDILFKSFENNKFLKFIFEVDPLLILKRIDLKYIKSFYDKEVLEKIIKELIIHFEKH